MVGGPGWRAAQAAAGVHGVGPRVSAQSAPRRSTWESGRVGGQALRASEARVGSPPFLSPLIPYDEVKVRTSKHKQTQQCGDSPVSHRGKGLFQSAGSTQVPATMAGQEALGRESGVPPLPTTASSSSVPSRYFSTPGCTQASPTEGQAT